MKNPDDFSQIAGLVRDSRYQGDSYLNLDEILRQEPAKVMQNLLIRLAQIANTLISVGDLEVEEDQIQVRENLVGELRPLEIASGLDRHMNVARLKSPQQVLEVTRKHRAFAARKRYAPTRMAIKGSVPQQGLDEFFHGPVCSNRVQRPASADFSASPTPIAFAPINASAIIQIDGSARTGLYTCAAADTALFGEGEFGAGELSFGILAERAAKRTSFEEHNRTNARAVLAAVPFDFDNQRPPSFHLGHAQTML